MKYFIDMIVAILYFGAFILILFAVDPGFFKTIFMIWIGVMILSLFLSKEP